MTVLPESANHGTEAIDQMWYVVEDTQFSCWAIANTNKPVEELAYENGELVRGHFLSKEIADHIVHLHNRMLRMHQD